MKTVPILPVLLLLLPIVHVMADESLTIDQVLILVMDQQDNPYHSTRSLEFITKVQEQALGSNVSPDIRLLSHRYRKQGAWTLFPVLADLYKSLENKHKFVFICEEETRIDLKGFLGVLKEFNSSRDLFLGFGLVDQEPSVIHHYAFHNDLSGFMYPHPTAGFVLTRSVLENAAKTWLAQGERKFEFSIDAYHEFAKYLYYMKEHSVELTHIPEFCTHKHITTRCVTWQSSDFPNCGKPVSLDDIFFAVKTCEKFHSERINVIKSTWTKDVKHIEFFSDKEDSSIPTIDLGVPNTIRGHCGKTLAILRRALKETHINSKSWFVLADDDTLLSVSRLQKLLACYDHEDTIALGERYGYGASNGKGYDYITLGGGMVLSRHTIVELLDNNFSCANEDPDDMMIGMYLTRLNIPVIHSPYFHQARPADYALEYLRSRKAVSFHRFTNNNPQKVYRDYLSDIVHEEL